MKVSSPGRFGDSLWTGPTLRAIAEAHGPVDLILSKDYGRDDFLDLWRAQSYIKSATRCDDWLIREEAPIQPWEAPVDCDAHLGYRGWPQAPTLYEESWRLAVEQLGPLPELRMDEPWIKAVPCQAMSKWVQVAFSFHWAELKAGILFALTKRFPDLLWVVTHDGRRWPEWEGISPKVWMPCYEWKSVAATMAATPIVLCDLSAQWVLANAMGKNVICVEPMEGRARNPVFWRKSPRNHMTLGGDGLSTFDSTAVGDLIDCFLLGG